MMGQDDAIRKIVETRKPKADTEAAPVLPEEGDKFYSILVGDGLVEQFFEVRFSKGIRTCFAYHDLSWFNLDPESEMLDLEFGGYLVTLKGRGLGERLFDGIKQKRVAWIKEADVEMQDHPANNVFIKEILITPPSSAEEEKTES